MLPPPAAILLIAPSACSISRGVMGMLWLISEPGWPSVALTLPYAFSPPAFFLDHLIYRACMALTEAVWCCMETRDAEVLCKVRYQKGGKGGWIKKAEREYIFIALRCRIESDEEVVMSYNYPCSSLSPTASPPSFGPFAFFFHSCTSAAKTGPILLCMLF